jgi:hypothetical protein
MSSLFIAALVCAGVANAAYFLMLVRLRKAGVRVKLFATIRDLFRVLSKYRELAPTRGWSLWPVYAFWVATIGVIALFGLSVAEKEKW